MLMDAHNYDSNWPVIERIAVRGIIFIDGKLLMIENSFGEAKLPGGGREGDEDDVRTLLREVEEETGYWVMPESIVPFGEVEERRKSTDEDKIWHQISRLYFCDVKAECHECHYTQNELKHGFHLVRYSIEEALAKNKAMFAKEGKQAWNQREYNTMQLIKKYIEQQNTDIVARFYENNVYGKWRSGEKVSYTVLEETKRKAPEASDNPFVNMFKLSTTDEGKDVEIHVEGANGKNVTFTVRAYVPKGCENAPFIVCMHPVLPLKELLAKGCAAIFMDTSMVAEDNCLHRGVFYELYPYTEDADSQTGELMAWSWAASKVLDAVYAGLDKELGLDADYSMVTGVSRWGKATAVCGAFEKRFKVVIPVCSGAGGLAAWKYQSEGRSYDLSECGGPKDYVYGTNEPLSCLQSDAERGWFADKFLEYKEYADIPFEQYMLPVMAADKNRKYFVIAAHMGEDWVNAPAMWETYERALKVYTEKGLEQNLKAYFHKEGHALLAEDVEFIFNNIDRIN